jgi:Flp pilus assembly pilin Flp
MVLRRKAQGMTEYIIIIVLIAVACLAIVAVFGGKVKGMFTTANTALDGTGATGSSSDSGSGSGGISDVD